MARPRGFDTAVAVEAARDAFWARGYEATSMADLEGATSLSRSSLYQAFGSKRELFEAALAHYQAHQMDPLLAPLEREGSGPPELRAYLSALAAAFRSDGPLAARGCLVVNTMAELADHDEAARSAAAEYQERVVGALGHALEGGGRRAGRTPGARTLYAAIVGALVMSHVDGEAAATLCEELAAEFAS